MQCGNCSYQFALDPKINHCADGRFLAMVRRVSADGTRYFTANQLVTTFRCDVRGRWTARFAAVLLLVFAFVFSNDPFIVGKFIAGVLTVVAFLAFVISFRSTVRVKPDRIYECIDVYTRSKGKIQGLIVDEQILKHTPRNWPESDVYDYGVEGVLIVEHDRLVELFVMNELHTELRVLVVSATGYPDYIADRANQILTEQEDVPVYTLHDASRKNDDFAERLTNNPNFRLQGKTIIDLGFQTDDVKNIKGLKRFRHGRTLPVDAIPWKKAAGLALLGYFGANVD